MRSFLILALFASSGCGARTAVEIDPVERPTRDASVGDGATDARVDAPWRDAGPDSSIDAGCIPVDDGCSASELCMNGSDDDCDFAVDEGCPCAPGAVQPCFAGSPGHRNVGACQDGAQICSSGGAWGACEGGILPNADVCTGRDDLCDGCSHERICPIDCPSPGDPRVPTGAPFAPYRLSGRDFYAGPVTDWRWTVEGGVCDALAPRLTSFELTTSPDHESAVLVPRLSGDYRVTLQVTTPRGVLSCSWVVNVAAPGLRVEMCYPESETQDLDLFLHNPHNTLPWYLDAARADEAIADASCGWHNCEAEIRGTDPITGAPMLRADWGYANSPIENCVNGPHGTEWGRLGFCANPRLDIDNNLSKASGMPENINVDAPLAGQVFRIMIQNWTGTRAHPVVNVYCDGRRNATFGREPDGVRLFEGNSGASSVGAMWRVADVTVMRDPATDELVCSVDLLHPPGRTTGYYVTYDDSRY